MGQCVGIYLGMDFSLVAACDNNGRPHVLDSAENRPQVPSVVGLRKKGKNADSGSEIVVGDAAEKNHPVAPNDTIYSIMRLMGRGYADTEVQKIRQWASYAVVEPSDGTRDSVRVVMGGKQYSPVDISAMILKKLKEDAEFRLGDEVTHAVITVPAHFNQAQKAATRDAGLKAGLTVIQVLDEPTAAAISHGREFGAYDDPEYVLVYDLGTGTFEVSLLLACNGSIMLVSIQGNAWLGSSNFDQVLVDHSVNMIKDEYGINPTTNHRFMVELRRAARSAKEQLSSARSASIILSGVLQDETGELVDVEIDVTRDECERLIRPLVDETMAVTRSALENAKLTPDMIDLVLTTGDANCTPLIRRSLEDLFGPEKVMRKTHPKHSEAMGAAICAHKIAEQSTHPEVVRDHRVEITPIVANSYGVQVSGDKFYVLVRKGDTYPTPQENIRTLSLRTAMPNQRLVTVPIYGGDNLERASANEKQGEAFALLPPGLPEGSEIIMGLWFDGDMVFDLDIRLADGTEVPHRILRGEADQKAIEALQNTDSVLNYRSTYLPPEQMELVSAMREQVFAVWVSGDYETALQQANHLGAYIDTHREFILRLGTDEDDKPHQTDHPTR